MGLSPAFCPSASGPDAIRRDSKAAGALAGCLGIALWAQRMTDRKTHGPNPGNAPAVRKRPNVMILAPSWIDGRGGSVSSAAAVATLLTKCRGYGEIS